MSEQLADAWIYIVGPIAGALAAVMVAWLLRGYTIHEAIETAVLVVARITSMTI